MHHVPRIWVYAAMVLRTSYLLPIRNDHFNCRVVMDNIFLDPFPERHRADRRDVAPIRILAYADLLVIENTPGKISDIHKVEPAILHH